MLFVKLNFMPCNVPQIALMRQAAYLESVVLPSRYLAMHGVQKKRPKICDSRHAYNTAQISIGCTAFEEL